MLLKDLSRRLLYGVKIFAKYVDASANADGLDIAVDGDKVGLVVPRQPDEVDVAVQQLLYLAARIDIVHVGIQDDLEHHLRMIRIATRLLVELAELSQVKVLHDAVYETYRIIFRNIFVDSLRKKDCLIGYVRNKVYLCHSFKTTSKLQKNFDMTKPWLEKVVSIR